MSKSTELSEEKTFQQALITIEKIDQRRIKLPSIAFDETRLNFVVDLLKISEKADKILTNYAFKIASYFHNYYKHICVRSSSLWYMWNSNNNKWESFDNMKIIDKFINEQKKQNNDAHILTKIIELCKSLSFKRKVTKKCESLFYDEYFLNKLDKNPWIFPFNNCVYDCKTYTFRDTKQTDYIFKTSPIDYDFNLTINSPEVKKVFIYLEQVFPDSSIRKYFMDVMSDIFQGGNFHKKGYFWTCMGKGDNGKSVLQSLFEYIFGSLVINLPTSIITGKPPINLYDASSPELVRAGSGVRLVMMCEPNEDEKIHSVIFKTLIDNDTYYARDLYERKLRKFNPMFKFVFVCNKLPKLKYSDQDTWNRISVIPFESTFVDLSKSSNSVAKTHAEQMKQKRFPMDKHMSKKIPQMGSAFVWVLLRHRKMMKGKNIVTPKKIREAIENYKANN